MPVRSYYGDMKHRPHAIIIGGGIGGPAASLFLRRADIEPRIFEAYPEPTTTGGGFQIAPNGMRVLNALGLADRVRAAGVTSSNFVFRNQQGKVISQIGVSGSGTELRLFAPSFTEFCWTRSAVSVCQSNAASGFAASSTKAMLLSPASRTVASSEGTCCWPLTACIPAPVH